MNMPAAERNRLKQRKNAKRGGYTPTIAKDVNKHKIQKLQRMINDIRREAESIDELDQFDKGYKQALLNIAEDLKEVL